MPIHKDVIASVEKSPRGPHIGAIFDFDGTLIAGFSAVAFLREQVKRGDISPREFAELAVTMTNFGLGNVGFSALMMATSQFMRGTSEASYMEFGEELYRKHIARLIYPESRALVEAHMQRGHTVAVISSATPYQVVPAARDLGIKHVYCTQYEVKDGKFTGGLVRPTCWGEGKVTAAEKLASETGINLNQSFFYSDSDDDLALLERVGHPQPLNPNRKLAAIAQQRGWPTRRFASRGRPKITDWVRSVAATGSLVTAFAAGLPIWALTGSKREAQNFSFSLFADMASALIGMNLEVKGEKHLWEQRPAVFVFNHQSKADVIIIARLLRRDIAGVGKQEIKKMPIIGQVLEFGGVVMIDRENSKSAIDAMSPLVDVMRNEGKSVCLSPEGTRTITPRLGAFKKGAFHLAMQAGVPMVPIVIHNALDIAPKGDFVFRSGTVSVQVLPPVDTANWNLATLDQHVDEVRQMFLVALGQAEPVKAAKLKKTQAEPKANVKVGTKAKIKAKTKAKAAVTKQASLAVSTPPATAASTKVKPKPKRLPRARPKIASE